MARSSKKHLPELGLSPQRKTLFLPAPGKLGVIVTMGLKPKHEVVKFADGLAAFKWCVRNRVNLNYYFNEIVAQN